MPTVVAVMLITVCDPDLVHCEPMKTWDKAWESVETCDRDKTRILSEIKAQSGNGKTVMGKCRLYLDEDHIFSRSMLAETPSPATDKLF